MAGLHEDFKHVFVDGGLSQHFKASQGYQRGSQHPEDMQQGPSTSRSPGPVLSKASRRLSKDNHGDMPNVRQKPNLPASESVGHQLGSLQGAASMPLPTIAHLPAEARPARSSTMHPSCQTSTAAPGSQVQSEPSCHEAPSQASTASSLVVRKSHGLDADLDLTSRDPTERAVPSHLFHQSSGGTSGEVATVQEGLQARRSSGTGHAEMAEGSKGALKGVSMGEKMWQRMSSLSAHRTASLDIRWDF